MLKRACQLLVVLLMAGTVVATVSPASFGAAGNAAPVSASLPTISPTPRTEQAFSAGFALPPRVSIVAGENADQSSIGEVETILSRYSVASDVVADDTASNAPVLIYVGGPDETPATTAALAQLGVQGPAGLPAEGYVLAAGVGKDGRSRIVLSGVDATGTYYATQSLRQVIELPEGNGRAHVPGVLVRDWPGFGFRGGMESFYGPEWSQSDRLSQVDFLAEHKMDTFFYGPAGDARTGSLWSSTYGADELARLQQVVQAAQAHHINFIYRISPEAPLTPSNGICHSSDVARADLLGRLQQLWDIGIRQFVIAWDDVAGHFTCSQDQQAYGSDVSPTAAAQTSVVDFVQQQFIDSHSGALPLITVPTQYSGDSSSTYRTRFDGLLTPQAQVYWTGPQVVSPSITLADITATQQAYPTHKLVVWDNYPVNDYATNRLLLAPLNGRDAGLDQRGSGITFNELQEQEPSQVVLFTEADYAWNPEAYSPTASWDRGLRELGGSLYPALRTFAENNYSSVLDPRESLTLNPLLSAFRQAYSNFGDVSVTADALDAEFASMQAATSDLKNHWGDALFLSEAKPWLDKLALYGAAGHAAVDMLRAQLQNEPVQAWQDRVALESILTKLRSIGQSIAPGVMDPFLTFARNESDGFLGTAWSGGVASVTGSPAAAAGSSLRAVADRDLSTAYHAASAPAPGDALTLTLSAPRPVADITVLQDPASLASGTVQGRDASGNWVTLGSFSSGYVDVNSGGQTVDAVRLLWSAGSPAPTIYEVIPHYADALPATVTVDRTRLLAASGSNAQFAVTVRGESSGTLTASLGVSLPKGWSAQPSVAQVSLRSEGRTVQQTYAFTISVPGDAQPGNYPLNFVATSSDGVRSAAASASIQVGTASSLPYSNLVLSNTPLGYWRLGEKSGTVAADATGNGLAGSYVPNVSLGLPGALNGDADTAAGLNGGYVNVPDNVRLHVTGAFTLEAWIKPSSVATSPGEGIIERYDSPAKNGEILRLAAGNHLQAWVLGPSGYSSVTGSTAIPVGSWHHVAAVFTGRSLTVYVDGLSDGSQPTSTLPGAGSGPLRIGARGDDANQRLSGGIDEVAVYNQGLSADQVAADYLTGVR